ncbi:MAG: DUF1385 domain-containing protein [Clostridia bacterium]|nr:DUF1385 domain-containing protein [Clostridia bacterium]
MRNECCAAKAECAKKTSIGGQALIEGVMMRGPFVTAMAVRHTSGDIVMEEWPTKGKDKPRWMKLPLIRGVFNMVESMVSGYKCLMRSAELSGLEAEEEAAEAAKKAAKAAKKAAKKGIPTEPVTEVVENVAEVGEEAAEAAEEIQPVEEKPAKAEPKKSEKILFAILMAISLVLGLGLSIVLFMWLPVFLYNSVLKEIFPALSEGHRWVQSVFEGVLRLAIFLGYVAAVSLMKDIKRVFMYHGAEHKSIFCYEKGLDLTVENVRQQSRFHPRCGTSFLVLALIVGILVSLCVPIYDNTVLRTVVKLLLIPVVVAVGYELIKLAGRKDNTFTRIISKPGIWVQRLTTKEPDDSMIECAIAALKAVIPEDPDADKW